MPLAKADASWSDYVEHLHILAAWLVPLEQWLSCFSDGPQGQNAPVFICYSEFIATDLGEAYTLPQLSSPIINWSKNQDSAYRWGISYVIEGSQLGGEFLYKRLAPRLAPHKLLYLQRKQEGRWSAFLQTMAREVITQEQITRACEGAIDAFDALLKELRHETN